MSDSPVPIPEAIELLRIDDEDAADAVVDALQWMLGDAPLSRLNQAGLQQFLWYELPYKWLGGAERHLAVVGALGRFFALAGLPRYADLCSDPFTSGQIRRFGDGAWSDAFVGFLRRHEASGVAPPDGPDFAWGDLMGPAEFEAYWEVAMGLELAVRAGLVRPGMPGWRAAQHEVVRSVRGAARADRFGQTLAEEIALERLAAWIDGPPGGSQARRQVLDAVAHRLLHDPPAPSRAGAAVAPLRWLVDAIADDGIALTAGGALPGRVVADAAAQFGARLGWRGATGVPRREAQVPGLVALRDLACRTGLVRVSRGRLRTSQEAHGGPRPGSAALWRRMAAGLVPVRGVDAITWPVFLALLAGGPRREERLVREASVVLTESGRVGARGGPLDPVVAEESWQRLRVALVAVGALARRPPGVDRPEVLTSAGDAVALAALRHLATAPVRRAG